MMRVGVGLFAALALTAAALGQAVPSGRGPSQSLWVGGEYSNMQAGFPNGSNWRLNGIGGFANFNWTHHVGVEAHVRFMDFHDWNGETQQHYLAGPRYTFLKNNRLRPFASFQVGIDRVHYPFSLGDANFFALAPGGGLDYHLSRKWSVRASYEYHFLPNSPNFSNEPKFGIRPNGFQAGVAYRIF